MSFQLPDERLNSVILTVLKRIVDGFNLQARLTLNDSDNEEKSPK
jgi:hypothetical protein